MTHVLLTRPLEASQQLAFQLDLLGLSPIVMPFYSFAPVEAVVEFDSSASGRKLAIFTSPRAVEYGLPLILPKQIAGLEMAVIGSASGAALKSAGYPEYIQASSGYTSEDLLQAPEITEQAGEAIIFCAPGGREALITGLNELGWHVSNAMVYERQALQPDDEQLRALADTDNLISVWTSMSAVKLAQSVLPRGLWEKILQSPSLVISKRIQHDLKSMGAMQVEVTDGPGNNPLLKAIIHMSER